MRASCRLQPFGQVVPDCCSLSSASSRQRVSALHSSVRLRLVHILLAISSPELTSDKPPPNLPRVRRKARLFPLVRDSPAVSLSGPFMSGLYAPRGSLSPFQVPGFPPSLPSPLVSSSLPAPTPCPSIPTKNLTPPARPSRSNVVAVYLYAKVCASAGVTVLPRINLYPSSACRAVPACLLALLPCLVSSLTRPHQPHQKRRARPRTHAPATVQTRTGVPRPEEKSRRIKISQSRGLRPPRPLQRQGEQPQRQSTLGSLICLSYLRWCLLWEISIRNGLSTMWHLPITSELPMRGRVSLPRSL